MAKAKATPEKKPLWGIEAIKIPILYILGETGAGKTTAAYSIAPQPSGLSTPPRVLHIDFENSGVDHQRRFHVTRVDLSGDPLAFGKMVEGLNEVGYGEYDVIIIDPISDWNYDSVCDYLLSAKIIKSKHADKNVARRLASADILAWQKMFFGIVSNKCQTLVLISHLKKEFDKAAKEITDRYIPRGFNFMEISTLTVRLFAPSHIDTSGKKPNAPGYKGEYWASLVGGKNRLVATVFDEESGEAITVKALPDVMRFENGTSLPAFMRKEFKSPSFDTGEQLQFDPMADTLTDADVQARELALLTARHGDELLRLKKKLIADLTSGDPKYYTDGLEVGKAISDLKLTDEVNNPAKIYPDVHFALVAWAKKRDADKALLAELSVAKIFEGDDAE